MLSNRFALMGLVGLLTMAAVPGCAAEEEEADGSAGAISKPKLQVRLTDLRRITTENFDRVSMKLGTGALSNLLKVRTNYGSLQVGVGDTHVFGKVAEQKSIVPNGGKVKSLDEINRGLATQLGESELPTELARLRLKHLSSGTDNYYVETSWGLGGAIVPDMSHDTGGFGDNDTKLKVGFQKGKDVTARVVVATPESNLQDVIDASGGGIARLRDGVGGFVIPENVDEILAMKPGEAFGLTGTGIFAAHFGMTSPFLIADAGPFAYTFAVSAALSHTVSGELDIELVRLDGDEVAVDVGIRNGQVDERSFGITGNWGFANECDAGQPCLSGVHRKIAKIALGKRVKEFMATSINVAGGENVQRLELARMRFNLHQGDELQRKDTQKALEQVLHGDLRHAQAIYAKNLGEATPPVTFDFDMLRASTTSSRTFGAKVFGIDIYHKVAVEKQGSFAVQTPNGVQSVLWDSFKKTSGWFQMDHGSKVTAISSASLGAANPDDVINQANVLVQAVVGDEAMDDDVLLDSTDALIVMLAGKDALSALNAFGTPMQEAVGAKCPIQREVVQVSNGHGTANKETWDEACNVSYLAEDSEKIVHVDGTDYTLSGAREAGVRAFMAQPQITELPAEYRALMEKAAGLRLTLQMVKIHAVQSNGPGVSFALNYRLDDAALGRLAKLDDAKFIEASTRYFSVVGGERVGVPGGKNISDADATKAAKEMLKVLTRYKGYYRNVSENESQDLPALLAGKPYARLAIGIRFDVSDVADAEGEERMERYLSDVKRIRVESLSHQRALLGKELYTGLVKAADSSIRFGNTKGRLFAEQAAAYPLIATMEPSQLEVGMDLAADVSSSFWAKRERFIKAGFQAVAISARGKDVDPITSNLFDIDRMLNAP